MMEHEKQQKADDDDDDALLIVELESDDTSTTTSTDSEPTWSEKVKANLIDSLQVLEGQNSDREVCAVVSLVPTLGVTPSPMEVSSVCYIPQGLLLFGGYSPDYKSAVCELWMLSFETWMGEEGSCPVHTPTWTQVSWRGSEAPSPRASHVAAMLGTKMLVYGGFSGSEFLGDTWLFDLEEETWTQLRGVGPSCRRDAACTFYRDKIYVHGGADMYGALGDMWVFDGSCWSEVQYSAESINPGPIYEHQISNHDDKELWLTGGVCEGKVSPVVWRFSISTSSWLADAKMTLGFVPRARHQTAFLNDLLLVTGGTKASSPNDYVGSNDAIQVFDIKDGSCFKVSLKEYGIDGTLSKRASALTMYYDESSSSKWVVPGTVVSRRDFILLPVSPTTAWLWGGRSDQGYCRPAAWSIDIRPQVDPATTSLSPSISASNLDLEYRDNRAIHDNNEDMLSRVHSNGNNHFNFSADAINAVEGSTREDGVTSPLLTPVATDGYLTLEDALVAKENSESSQNSSEPTSPVYGTPQSSFYSSVTSSVDTIVPQLHVAGDNAGASSSIGGSSIGGNSVASVGGSVAAREEECSEQIQSEPGRVQSHLKEEKVEEGIKLWRKMTNDAETTKVDYVLGGMLGRGASGTVYKCMDRGTGDFFAAKRLSFSALDVPQMKLLAKEIVLLKDLIHPHIVSYRGYDIVEANLYIFMDFCPGGDLHTVLRSFGGLSVTLTKRYGRQITSGLEYLHNASVLHRDIKAGNVLLTVSGQAKLSDFGLARIMRDGSRGVASSVASRSVVGSPYWMAPEVIRGQGSSKRSDIWSLGATIFEMAAAVPPLAHLEAMAALFHIGNNHPINEPPDSLGSDGKDFVKICLNYSHEERPTSTELLQHPFLTGGGASEK